MFRDIQHAVMMVVVVVGGVGECLVDMTRLPLIGE